MTKNIRVLIVILCVIMLQLSCKKFLDEKSNAALLVPSTLSDFQKLLDDGQTMYLATTPSLGASSSDDYFIETASLSSKSIYEQQLYKWVPYPHYYMNDWSVSYKALYTANLCLERLPMVDRTSVNASEWDNIKGSAMFYKAYYYLELVWIYAKAYDPATAAADMGIVQRDGTDFFVPSVRSNVEESYTAIVSYAKGAASLLPPTALSATRPSKCAAYGLLARTYLSMRMYDSAGKYANLSYQLANGLMDYNDAAVVGLTASVPFKLLNREVLFHATMNTTVPLYSPTTGPARIDTVLFSSYHINDLRRKAFFTASGSYSRFKGTYSGASSRMYSGIAADEVLLMRAECLARAGDREGALADINRLLQYRFAPANFIPVTAATAPAALEIILTERRKELLFRGSLRWMDVKRLNKEGRNIRMRRLINNEIFELSPNDQRTALQIPQDIIDLTGIEQN